ncbi:TPA: hypothetical protein DDZ86_04955 [Candidatus Dependentiae bacterium]|nr:MAG: hypothetical protein A2Y17_09760 [Clostridiales bacterium GWF2_38_85]HBL98960.1 hypothetical protein [Candidatus Dependentiae bacterium]
MFQNNENKWPLIGGVLFLLMVSFFVLWGVLMHFLLGFSWASVAVLFSIFLLLVGIECLRNALLGDED